MTPKISPDERIAQFRFDAAYPLYLNKIEKKGRTEEELLKVIKWLTGFNKTQVKKHVSQRSTIEEFFAMVGQVSGVRAPRHILPHWLAKGIAATDEWLGMKLRGEPLHFFPGPVVVEMAQYYWGLESLYAKDELGYESREPLETLRDTVEWLRANHPKLQE